MVTHFIWGEDYASSGLAVPTAPEARARYPFLGFRDSLDSVLQHAGAFFAGEADW